MPLRSGPALGCARMIMDAVCPHATPEMILLCASIIQHAVKADEQKQAKQPVEKPVLRVIK